MKEVDFRGSGGILRRISRSTALTNNRRSAMYGVSPAAPVVATTTTVGALTLPNTGGNFVVTLAVSVAAGLVAWGVLYARAAR